MSIHKIKLGHIASTFYHINELICPFHIQSVNTLSFTGSLMLP